MRYTAPHHTPCCAVLCCGARMPRSPLLQSCWLLLLTRPLAVCRVLACVPTALLTTYL
jgi:hypothetical protein